LQILVIDEISLVSNRMLTFIDSRLRNIKRIHNKIMGGLDVIMIGYFYQATLVQDSWILKSRINGLNVLGTHFWQENIKCYELKQVMHQNDLQFIHILNISILLIKFVYEHHQ
jgi:hypothetical protein